MWYAFYERDHNGTDLTTFQSSAEGAYRFPQSEVEEGVSKYFGPVGEHLRDVNKDGIFDPETNEYVLSSLISNSDRSICLTKIEELGKTRNLFFTITTDQTSRDYLLTLEISGGSFQYHSLTEQG